MLICEQTNCWYLFKVWLCVYLFLYELLTINVCPFVEKNVYDILFAFVKMYNIWTALYIKVLERTILIQSLWGPDGFRFQIVWG